MKHNTHIYLAYKAIELLRDSVDNLRTMTGKKSQADTRPLKAKAKRLQRLMLSHADAILEASWAPDDILADMARFHIFKLYTPAILPDRAESYRAQTYQTATGTYYRGPGGGGLPYKVDHLAALIADLGKLRAYNDNFSVRELVYLYVLISHYVVDAHVPMHCDLRDDPPSKTDKAKPGPATRYFKKSLHGQVEDMWDRAVTPVAIAEGIVTAETYKDESAPTDLSPHVTFHSSRRTDRQKIRPVLIPDGALMELMINRCVQSYERSQTHLAAHPAGQHLLHPKRHPPSHHRDLRRRHRRRDLGLDEHMSSRNPCCAEQQRPRRLQPRAQVVDRPHRRYTVCIDQGQPAARAAQPFEMISLARDKPNNSNFHIKKETVCLHRDMQTV
jgi:hypothetical protein